MSAQRVAVPEDDVHDADGKVRRPSEEAQMRDLVVEQLRLRWPSARIIHEPSLRYSAHRLDLAAVTDSEFAAVEIKSSIDKPDRLAAQLRAFEPVCNRMILALAPKWNPDQELVEHISPDGRRWWSKSLTPIQEIAQGFPYCEIWTVDAVANRVIAPELGRALLRQSHPWPRRMLDMLHRSELAEISQAHGWYLGEATHTILADRLAGLLTGNDAQSAFCKALRSRVLGSQANDPPIPSMAVCPGVVSTP